MVKIDSFIISKMANITLPWRGIAYFSLIMYVMVTIVYRIQQADSLAEIMFSFACVACYVYFTFCVMFKDEWDDVYKFFHFCARIGYAVLFVTALLTLSPLAIASGFMAVLALYADAAHTENLQK